MRTSKTKYFLANHAFLISVIAVLCTSILSHFYKLGEFPFWTDEIYHVIAANSINQYGSPTFPSGDEYDRALPFTQTVALLFSIFGENEFVARMPSVISHLIFLGIFLCVMRKWFNRYGAILAIAVISLSPYTLDIVRQCRMYGVLQLFNLLAIIFAYWALNPHTLMKINKHFKKQVLFFLYATLFLLFLWAAYSIHLLALLVLPGLSVFVVLMGLKDLAVHGPHYFRYSPYVIMTVGGILIMLISWLLFPEYIHKLYERTQQIPTWAQNGAPFSKLTYFHFLRYQSPFLVVLLVFGVFWLPYRYKSVGTYIICLTLIPLALHSIFFALKGSRYIFTLYPYIILIASITLVDIIIFISRSRTISRNASGIFSFIILGLFLYTIIPSPSTLNSSLLAEQRPDWGKLKSLRKSSAEFGQCYFTTSQNLFYYYAGFKPHYFIRARANSDDAEYFTGAPVIESLKQLKLASASCDSSIIITNKKRLDNPSNMTVETAKYIRSNWFLQSSPNEELVIYSNKLAD